MEQDRLFDFVDWLKSVTRTEEFGRLSAILAILAIPLVLYFQIFATDNLFWGNGSVCTRVLPRFAVDYAVVQLGHLPGYWNFGLFTGVPWVAGGNSTHYPIYILLLKFFPIKTAHSLYLLLHMYVACFAFARLLRNEGTGWGPAVMSGAIFISVGPIPHLLVSGQYESFVCVCFWPLLAALAAEMGLSPKSRFVPIYLSLVFWLSFMTGSIDFACLGLIVGLIFYLRHAHASDRLRGLLTVLICFGFSVLCGFETVSMKWALARDAATKFDFTRAAVASPLSLLSILNLNFFYPSSIQDVWFPWFDGLCQLGPTCLCIPLLLMDRSRFSGFRKFGWASTAVVLLLAVVLAPQSWAGVLPSGRQFATIGFFVLIWQTMISLETFLSNPASTDQRGPVVYWVVGWATLSLALCYLPASQTSYWHQLLVWLTGENLEAERSQGILVATFLRTSWLVLLTSIIWIVSGIESSSKRIVFFLLVIFVDLQTALYPMIATATPDLYTLPNSTELFVRELGNERLLLPIRRQGQALSLGNHEIQANFPAAYGFQHQDKLGIALSKMANEELSEDVLRVFTWLGGRYLLTTRALEAPIAGDYLRQIHSEPTKEQFVYELRSPRALVELVTDWREGSDFAVNHYSSAQVIEASTDKLVDGEELSNVVLDISGLRAVVSAQKSRLVVLRLGYSQILRYRLDNQPVEAFPLNGGVFTGVVCSKGEHTLTVDQPQSNTGLPQWLPAVLPLLGAISAIWSVAFWFLNRLAKFLFEDSDGETQHGDGNQPVEKRGQIDATEAPAVPMNSPDEQPQVDSPEAQEQQEAQQ